MTCETVRDRLTAGDPAAELLRHRETCPDCARFAARLAAARSVLGRRAEIAPPPGFARRVTARRAGATEILGRLALRALPAAAVLALALAWVGLEQAPQPLSAFLADEPTQESLFAWTALGAEGAER